MQRIYLDYAAASPLDDRVMTAMQPYFSDIFYNPSALYKGARDAKAALDDARSSIAQSIGSKPSEIVFTAGGTESANLAINGIMKLHPEGKLMVSSIEHEAVLNPAKNYQTYIIPVDGAGVVKVQEIIDNCTNDTVLISVMLANNEIGTIQPIKEISEIVQNIRKNRKKAHNKTPLYLHIDACQAPLYLDINVARLGVDLMSLNGGKIYGPKQSGLLYVKAGVVITPMIEGGGQEWGYRSGTENVAFAVGFAKALSLAEKGRHQRTKDMLVLRDYFMKELERRFDAEITGHRTQRLAHNIHAILPDTDNERVIFALDDAGIDAATGSACSASKDTPSHVLLAIGKSEHEARSSIRFTMGRTTTREAIDTVLATLEKAIEA